MKGPDRVALVRGTLNPDWQISGIFLDRFTGELIHQKIMSTFSV